MLKLLAKLLISTLAIYIVFKNIAIPELVGIFYKVDLLYFLGATLFIFSAQIISSFRMKYYLAADGKNISAKDSIYLYLKASFLNLFLPGGIGGDFYKIIKVSKITSLSKTRCFQIALSERASGLLCLLINAGILALLSRSIENFPYGSYLVILAIFVTIFAYITATKLITKEQTSTTIKAGYFSFFIQALGLIGIGLIYCSISPIGFYTVDYLALFLISVFVSILPISIGGIGIKELSFLTLANLFSLDPETGVALAFIHFLASSLVTILGGMVALISHKEI